MHLEINRPVMSWCILSRRVLAFPNSHMLRAAVPLRCLCVCASIPHACPFTGTQQPVFARKIAIGSATLGRSDHQSWMIRQKAIGGKALGESKYVVLDYGGKCSYDSASSILLPDNAFPLLKMLCHFLRLCDNMG